VTAFDRALVYGANGYTGRLVAEEAVRAGKRPIVAGRRAEAVEAVARELGLPHRVFDLTDTDAVVRGLDGVDLVIHCAGPYSATSRPMVDACLKTGTHYLDITGEYLVIDAVLSRDAEARDAGVVLMPAVGFDVVPTDCMARKLAEALPDAVDLKLAFGGGRFVPSPGTAKTTVEGLHLGSLARRGGEITRLAGPELRAVPFAGGTRTRTCMSIPWGDIASAFRTTGIPNITVFAPAPAAARRGARLLPLIAPVLRSAPVQAFLKRQVAARAKGPSEELRRSERMWIWGRVEDAAGRAVEGHLEVPEGYALTVASALLIADKVLSGKVAPGAWTPAGALGADLVTELPNAGSFQLGEPK
jgi:short subunit dehydrogenase-like uncharacterized protein